MEKEFLLGVLRPSLFTFLISRRVCNHYYVIGEDALNLELLELLLSPHSFPTGDAEGDACEITPRTGVVLSSARSDLRPSTVQ